MPPRTNRNILTGLGFHPGLFRRRGVKFSLGRDFLPEEGQPGKDHVVVLSHRLWKRLGSDPNILGKSVRLDNVPYTVVGVWAEGTVEETWNPLAGRSAGVQAGADINREDHWLCVRAG